MDPKLLAAIEAALAGEQAQGATDAEITTWRAQLYHAALIGDSATLEAAGVQLPAGVGTGSAATSATGGISLPQAPVSPLSRLGSTLSGHLGGMISGFSPIKPSPPPPKPPFPAPPGTTWQLLPNGDWQWQTTGGTLPALDAKGKLTGAMEADPNNPPKILATYKATGIDVTGFSSAIQDKLLGAQMARKSGNIQLALQLEKQAQELELAAGGSPGTLKPTDFSAKVQNLIAWSQELKRRGDVTGAAQYEKMATDLMASESGSISGPASQDLKDLEYYHNAGLMSDAQYNARLNQILLGSSGGMSDYQAGELDIARQRLGLDLTTEQRQRQATAIAAARSGEPLAYLSMLRGGAAPTAGGTDTYQGFPRLVPPAIDPNTIGMVSPNITVPGSSTAVAGVTAGGGPYADLIAAAEQQNNLPAGLLSLLMGAESSGINGRTSSEGAQGLLQLMPDTGKALGVTDPFDPVQNIYAGARYLKQQYDRFGNWPTALAAYNTGPENVANGIIPAVTHQYVNDIMAKFAASGNAASAVGTTAMRAPSATPPPGDFMGNIQQGQNALATMGAPNATRTLTLRAPALSLAPSSTTAWEPPPAPRYMTDIQAGRAIRPAGILPGLTPPGVMAQANMTPYETRALSERVGNQGQSEMDWEALLAKIRASMGPGLAVGSYGGRLTG